MTAALHFEQRVAALNERLNSSPASAGLGWTLEAGRHNYILILYRGVFVHGIDATGQKPGDLLRHIIDLASACMMFADVLKEVAKNDRK